MRIERRLLWSQPSKFLLLSGADEGRKPAQGGWVNLARNRDGDLQGGVCDLPANTLKLHAGMPATNFLKSPPGLRNAYLMPTFNEMHIDPQPGDMKPVGVYMAEWFGRKIYTLGMIHFAGEHGTNGQKVTAVAPPAPDSIESHLHALGQK